MILTDEQLIACSVGAATATDLGRRVESAVLAELAKQEPVGWTCYQCGSASCEDFYTGTKVTARVCVECSTLHLLHAGRQHPPMQPTREDWQPIETAPKDGTSMLVVKGNWIVTACWHTSAKAFCTCGPSYEILPRDEQPTHWLPLPAPPTNEPK